MNTRSKAIIKYLKADCFKLNNLIRKNNGNIKIVVEKFLTEMPKNFNKSTEHYTIDAYVDCKLDYPVAYSGWDMLGGPDPDRFILNGQECHITWNNKKALLEKIEHPEFYKKYKYTTSVENNNVKINLYTL